MDPVAAQPSENQHLDSVKVWLGNGSLNIFGRPFAGKDTQCHRLATQLDAPVISGGDILRSSNIPEHIRTIMERGELIPTDDYLSIATPYLSHPQFANRPLVLSSVGRWHGEELAIMQAAESAGHPIIAAIYLIIGEAEVDRRWQKLSLRGDRGNRADDAREILQKRLQEFTDKTLPVLDFYRSRNLLIEVDGSGSLDTVEAVILTKLYEKARLVG